MDVKYCSGQVKPEPEAECNRFPCPHYWEDRGWTACSRTCGMGVKTLKAGGECDPVWRSDWYVSVLLHWSPPLPLWALPSPEVNLQPGPVSGPDLLHRGPVSTLPAAGLRRTQHTAHTNNSCRFSGSSVLCQRTRRNVVRVVVTEEYQCSLQSVSLFVTDGRG